MNRAKQIILDTIDPGKIRLYKGEEVDDDVFMYTFSNNYGYIEFESNYESDPGVSFWIMGIDVFPEHRRQGHATRLMEALYELAHQTALLKGKQAVVLHGVLTDDGENMRTMIGRVAAKYQRTVKTDMHS